VDLGVGAGALPVRISASQGWRCSGASTTRYFLFVRIAYGAAHYGTPQDTRFGQSIKFA